MLTLYLALGIIGGGGALPITTPPERTFVVSAEGQYFTVADSMDPSDVMDFLVDLTALPAPAEDLGRPSLSVDVTSAALGFTILQQYPYQPVVIDNEHVRLWVTVTDGQQQARIWSFPHFDCAFFVDVDTTSVPPRHYQRTCLINVQQK
jgi:hypothetical protein